MWGNITLLAISLTLRHLFFAADVGMPERKEHTKGPRRWFREPLVHFILLAGLLFLIDHISTQSGKEQIVVGKETIDYLVRQREDLELRTLSPQERQETIDQYVGDEILYSEAYKRGLDRGDSRMRGNLILKMRGLLAGEVDEPTDEELRLWYDENRERFVAPETWSLEQVFFSDRQAVPEDLLARLRGGLNPSTVGEDRLDMRRVILDHSQRQLIGLLSSDVVRAVLAIYDDLWHGPFESPLGVHFIRITEYRPARQQSFEQVERFLTGEWMLQKTRGRIEDEVEKLRADYEVIVEDEGLDR